MNKKTQKQFIYRCSILLESGISLSESLDLLVRMEKSRSNRMSLEKMRLGVERGLSLSRSIEDSGLKFDKTFKSMITFGESSGILPASMRQAVLNDEKASRMKQKLFGALVYPSFIALATTGMTLFLVMYIFPKMIPLFSSLNIELPFITRFVLQLYAFLKNFGVWIISALPLAFIILAIAYFKNNKFKLWIQSLILRTPTIGIIIQKYLLSSQCRSMGTLLECGQTLLKSVGQVRLSTIEIYKNIFTQVEDNIERGMPISNSLRNRKIVPGFLPDMLEIGERTGHLSDSFNHVGRMYEEELEEFSRKIGSSLEPILMIVMGIVVGGVALSIILPIYEITNHLTR